jgi:hypothetical protein
MIPQPVTPETDPCQLSSQWKIVLRLAVAVVRMRARLPFAFTVLSGFRTAARQEEVGNLPPCGSGRRPCSTHTTCPATGVDLWPAVAVTNAVKALMGEAAAVAGLRWGGGSPRDADGFPVDWNHFDLGPVP